MSFYIIWFEILWVAYLKLGKHEIDHIDTMFAAEDRKAAGITAPPDGLYFIQCYYPEQFDLHHNHHSATLVKPTLSRLNQFLVLTVLLTLTVLNWCFVSPALKRAVECTGSENC